MLVITGTLFFFHHRGHGGHGVLLIKQKKLYVLCALCGEFPYLCSVMEKFELHILGCGSALPTTRHFATSQVVNVREVFPLESYFYFSSAWRSLLWFAGIDIHA